MAVDYDIKNKGAWLDISDILKPGVDEGPRGETYNYKMTIHTPSKDVAPYKLEAIDVHRDYVGNVAEFMLVRCYVPSGDFQKNIVQFREKLEVSITRIPINPTRASVRMDKPRIVRRYRAIFRADLNRIDSGGEQGMISSETKNLTGFTKVFLELHTRPLEVMRIKTTSGIFHNMGYENMLRGVMTSECNKIQIDGKPALDAFNMVKPDNHQPNNYTVIASLTPIVSLPTYLQEQMNGVYTHGLGSFFQIYRDMKTWFIYPLYALDRFDDDVYKAVFYSLPSNLYSGIDRTYIENGKTLKVIISGEKSYTDNGELGMINEGAGIRMSDQSAMMKKPWEINDARGPKGVSSKLNNEFVVKNRTDGLNYAKYRKNDSSSNPFLEASKIAFHQCAQVDLAWENGNPELLYPGMPAKYVFIEEGYRREVFGVILSVYSVTANQGQTIATNGHFMTSVAVTMAVQPYRRKAIDQ